MSAVAPAVPVSFPEQRPEPKQLVEAAATAVRSLEVSLAVASNLGWSDFSLRESQVKGLAEEFETLAKAFATLAGAAPDQIELRRSLERAVVALTAAEAADGLALIFRWQSPVAEESSVASLTNLVGLAADAMAQFTEGLTKRKLIKMNHKVHYAVETDASGRRVALGCLDCHRNIAHDKAQIETFRPRMASCFVGDCHRKDRNKDNCRRCHFQRLEELTAQAQ